MSVSLRISCCYHRVDSINGTAKESEDYVKVREIIEFKENEEEKQVRIIFTYIIAVLTRLCPCIPVLFRS